MLYRELIAACSEIHTKHINVLWAEQKISEPQSCWIIKQVLGFQRLINGSSLQGLPWLPIELLRYHNIDFYDLVGIAIAFNI